MYPLWLIISFGWIYYLIISEIGIWFSSAYAFQNYLIFVQPISMLGASYLLTKGNLLEIKKKLKPLLVISAILLVFAFTMIQWTGLTTRYGQYGVSVRYDRHNMFLLPENVTTFELETLYREASTTRYNAVFGKIWTFDALVFFSVFLILYVTNKNNRDE